MMVLALLSGGAIMDAEVSGALVGFIDGTQGEMRGQPASLVEQGTSIERLTFDNGNRISVYFSGDQVSFLAGKTISVGSSSYAFSGFSSITYNAPLNQTQAIKNSVTGTPIVGGVAYDVGVA